MSPQSLPLFISVNSQDDYGFQDGARAMRDIAQDHGVQLEYHESPGSHCQNIFPDELSEFLINFD